LATVLCVGACVACAPVVSRAKVIFDIDYSLDANFFFDPGTAAGRDARAALQRAAQTFSDRIVDNLTAITPGGGNIWAGQIRDPSTGLVVTAPATSIPVNVIKVYAGGRTLAAPDIAGAVAGVSIATGSVSFVNNANSRGQPGALATPKTDYGPWGGSIAFDDGTAWYFGLSPGGLPASRFDFLTIATHEFAHLLGFSASQASWANLVLAGKFTGAAATAANGGIAPSVIGSHWNSLTSTVGGVSQPALMNDSTPPGVRRRMTALDWGALDDIGWALAMPGDANADGQVNFTDFLIFETGFRQTNARWSQGDFNEDGVVGRADFILLYNNFGRRSGGGAAEVSAGQADALRQFAAAQGVPEPGGMLWLVASLPALGQRRGGRGSAEKSAGRRDRRGAGVGQAVSFNGVT
jgi:hypothetical protein